MTVSKRKKLVIERDKKCLECGSTDNLTVDHIIPLSRGGTSAMDNLRTLCGRCNKRKGSRIEWPWLERIMMALHVDELVERVRNELKGIVSANFGNLRAEISTSKKQSEEEYAKELLKRDEVIAVLYQRVKAMEKFHKIKWFREEFEGYRKVSSE